MSTHSKEPEKSDDGEPAKPSIKAKFRAWWEGYDLAESKDHAKADDTASKKDGHPAPPSSSGPPKPGMNRFGKPLWTASRIEVAEKIWGTSFVGPGSEEAAIELAKPFGLNPAMTLLEIGCGLGGNLRALVTKFGCWATGLEASPFLVQQAKERSTKAGLAKQAAVEAFDPEGLKYSKRVDAVFSKEVLYTIREKNALFDKLQTLIKPHGHILITDYVIDANARNAPLIKAWADREPQEPQLWTLEGALDAFAQCNFDLRVQEDITASHRAQIVTAIKALTDYLEKVHLDQETKINVIDEVETWALRVAALQSGLKCFRFYALKPGE